MRRIDPVALLAVLIIALLARPALVGAQANSGNGPFVGIRKLNSEKSHLPVPRDGSAIYRQYEDHGGGWMCHTVITITPRQTSFLFTAARYDSRQYPVYDAGNLGSLIRDGMKTPRTVEFTRINANEILWTDRANGKVVAGGACTVSADGNLLTITNRPPGRQRTTERVFDRVSGPGAIASFGAPARTVPETIAFRSGGKTLHGLLYRPAGRGPFPAVLYNHGGSPGLLSNVAFDAIAPHFVRRGWLFFAPYRRGQGLSADAGPSAQGEVAAIEKADGQAAANAAAVRLQTGEQLEDQLSALAWLEAQPFVQANRIAVMGNSVGGIQTVLGAERHAYCAAVDLTGAAMSWRDHPSLRKVMIHAVEHSKAPILFIQAENDYTIEPSKVLYAAMRRAHRDAQIHIYPPFHAGGAGGMQGHSIAWLGVSEWWPEAFGFVEEHCRAPLAKWY